MNWRCGYCGRTGETRTRHGAKTVLTKHANHCEARRRALIGASFSGDGRPLTVVLSERDERELTISGRETQGPTVGDRKP